MHYFGENFVTLGQNMDFNEYWCPSSDAAQVTLKLAAHYDWYDWSWKKTLKLSSRSQGNFQSKVTPK